MRWFGKRLVVPIALMGDTDASASWSVKKGTQFCLAGNSQKPREIRYGVGACDTEYITLEFTSVILIHEDESDFTTDCCQTGLSGAYPTPCLNMVYASADADGVA